MGGSISSATECPHLGVFRQRDLRYSQSLDDLWPKQVRRPAPDDVPDLSNFQAAGGKVIHVHGEADDSIPTGSSVHYYESVRSVMFPDLGLEEGAAAVNDFYGLFLVPGGTHCGTDLKQPQGGWPQTTLKTVIDWVENGVVPERLNNTGVIASSLCAWPLRPLWTNSNHAEPACVMDTESLATRQYDFNAYRLPLC